MIVKPTISQSKTGASITDTLWSGQSVWCKCKHHISCHENNEFPEHLIQEGASYGHCFFNDGNRCNCKEFQGPIQSDQ